MKFKLNIAWLYPDLMSTYGDRGNIIVLEKRCNKRGIEVKVIQITLESKPEDLEKCDLIFMGGAQDRQQKLASTDFLNKKAPLVRKMVEDFVPALFVCAAFQQVGRFYRPYFGSQIKGAGIFDLETVHQGDQAKRLIGNISAKLINPPELKGHIIVGFENHGGRTKLGKKIMPLAAVISGSGNDGVTGFEGGYYKNAIGSYFHGPILSKNPVIADWLIAKALEKKYTKSIILRPLDDSLSIMAKKNILKKIK